LHTPNEANWCAVVAPYRLRAFTQKSFYIHIHVQKEDKVIGAIMKKVIISCVAVLVGFGGVAHALQPDEKQFSKPDRMVSADRLPVPPLRIPKSALCGQWWDEMRAEGFSHADLPIADYIINRESRCNADANNSDDPVRIGKHKGSFGLFQINLFWISKTTAYPKGFLQTKLERNLVPSDLLNPEINIAAAKAIIDYNRANGGCGWTAWAYKGC
jgi:hypothetical protein